MARLIRVRRPNQATGVAIAQADQHFLAAQRAERILQIIHVETNTEIRDSGARFEIFDSFFLLGVVRHNTQAVRVHFQFDATIFLV